MKKLVFFYLAIILTVPAYAQTKFIKGYIIDNNGKRIDCLIKDLEWEHNPDQFEYKLTETADPISGSIENTQEFSVGGKFKYIRSTVDIDKSSNVITDLSSSGKPEYINETLFLKTLVEGEATLYRYSKDKGQLLRFFYQTQENEAPMQLIYKLYKVNTGEYATNTNYKNQLKALFTCESIPEYTYPSLKYSQNSLVKFFIQYNSCKQSMYKDYVSNKNKMKLHLSIRPGLNYSGMSLVNTSFNPSTDDFEKKVSFRLGAELEFILPVRNGKWAIIAEPTYQNYTSQSPSNGSLNVEYKSIELPVGFRYFVLNHEKSKVFLNFLLCFDFPIDSRVEIDQSYSMELLPAINFAIGGGYRFNNKLGLELRYYTLRENQAIHYTSDYSCLSFILSYQLF